MSNSTLPWRMLLLMSALAVLPFLPALSFAQETRAAIAGRVVDSTDAVIPAVVVRATNRGTNVTVSAESNADGNYEIPFLLPGMYRLTAELSGFKTFQREPIELRLGDRVRVDVQMQVGELAERVIVSAETPLIESATASMGQVIDERRMADMPIAHGNPYLLITLAPGVVYTRDPSLDRPFEPTHIVGYSMGGAPSNRNDIVMDGVSTAVFKIRTGGDAIAAYSPPADVVQEFKVQTVPFDASIGHTQGGVTSMAIKSGTNRLHGTLYHSLQNPILNSNLFFANRAGLERARFNYNRWGLSAQGPVMLPKIYNGRDRTFFSYGYEGMRDVRPSGGTYTVPTERERAGDFSALLALGSNYQIYDPSTARLLPDGRVQRDPLSGNTIPRSRISPIATNILSYWSPPNAPGTSDGRNNLVRENDPQLLNFYNHILRMDHNFSSSHRMFVRASYYKRWGLSPLRGYFRNVTTDGYHEWPHHGFSVDDVYHLSPLTFLNLRYGFVRLETGGGPAPDGIGFDLASLGFPRSYTDQISRDIRVFPQISISDYTGSRSNWTIEPQQQQSCEAHLASLRGNHTLRAGMDTRNFRTFNYPLGHSSTGLFNFAADWTRGPFNNSPASPKGQGLASMLLGLPASGGVDRNANFAEQSTVWSAYFQDDWKVTPRLTVNAGVRYEVEGPMTERFNRSVRGYDFNTPSPLENQVRAIYAAKPVLGVPVEQFRLTGGLTFAGVGGQPRALYSRDRNNLMPRAGFAYGWAAKTVIRGGYGIFFGSLGVGQWDVNQSGFSLRTNLIPSLDNGVTFVATLADPFPNGIQDPRGASDGLMTFVGRGISFFNERPAAPMQQRWQLSVQRELPQRVLFEAAYVGSTGSDLSTNLDYQPLPLEHLSRSPIRDNATINSLTQLAPSPFAGLLPGTALNAANISRVSLLSRGTYQHFTGLSTTENEGYSWYHALQLKTERRFAAGWTLNAGYTWSKSMVATGRLNGYLSPLEYVVSSEDRPHRLVVSGIFELPFGKGKKLLGAAPGVVDRVVGGWQVQGFYTAQTGPPLGFGNALFIGDIHDITLPAGQRSVERWFNVNAAFERDSRKQLAYNYRTLSQRFNDVRGDGTNQWDLSVIKNTRIRESMKVQFRAEFLNAFNHANFAAPNTRPISTAFGQVTSQAGYPRRIQLGLKILF